MEKFLETQNTKNWLKKMENHSKAITDKYIESVSKTFQNEKTRIDGFYSQCSQAFWKN